MYRRGLSRPDLSIEELKQQKAEFFIMEVFPVSLKKALQPNAQASMLLHFALPHDHFLVSFVDIGG